MAAKNKEGVSRNEFLIMVGVAVVFGFSAANFALPYAVENGYLSASSADNFKLLALLLLSAGSFVILDLFYRLLAQLQGFSLRSLLKLLLRDTKDSKR